MSTELKSETPIAMESCPHCGGGNIYHGPPDCPSCGAPNCCQSCCKTTSLEKALNEANQKVEEWKLRFNESVKSLTADHVALRDERDALAKEKAELVYAASDKIDFDQENQVAVCHCCGNELDDKGQGHQQSCLVELIISQKGATNLIILSTEELIAEIEKMPCGCGHPLYDGDGREIGSVETCDKCKWIERVKGLAV